MSKPELKPCATEEEVVRQTGDAIGYGRLMQLAEKIWGEKNSGAQFTIGACAAFMVPCKHWIKSDEGHCQICCGAGRVTIGVAEYMNETESLQARVKELERLVSLNKENKTKCI